MINSKETGKGELAIFLHVDRNVLIGVAEVLEQTLQPLWIDNHVGWNKLCKKKKRIRNLVYVGAGYGINF
jgi:hypothetical protein